MSDPTTRATVPAVQSRHPLSEARLERHVEQCIQERANLGHLYKIEDGPDGPEAMLTDRAAASLWRAVLDAIREAGWKVVRNV